jgi:glycosyltransferase involved in cell wall biosynthesis
MKKKLLIVGAFPPAEARIFGGIVTTCKVLLDSSFGDNFQLVLIDSTQISNPPPNLGIRFLLAIKRFIKFTVYVFSRKPDAVLLFTAVGASVLEKGAMAWVARMLPIPIFLFPRGAALIDAVNASPFQKMWVKAAMRGATHVLCQGPAWQRFAVKVLCFEIANAPIIENWSATPNLLAIGSARPLSQNHHAPNLLFLGWLEHDKGIFDLLEACHEVSKSYQFKLSIAGRGHAEKQARQYVTERCMLNCVEFVGWVTGTEKDAVLKNADILILPSWAEGFPNAIIEAMAAKVAVIVTTVGNVPDLITDQKEALLVPPRDSQALRVAIELLCKEPELRNSIANRGHIFARERFSVDRGIAKLTLTIENAISARGKKSCVG